MMRGRRVLSCNCTAPPAIGASAVGATGTKVVTNGAFNVTF